MTAPHPAPRPCRRLKEALAGRLLPMAVAALLLLTAACSSSTAEEKAVEGAKVAAKYYYDQLIGGHYDEFVSGCYGSDTLPDNYRRQLTEAARLFMSRLEKKHGGVREVRMVSAERDTLHQAMMVYLVLCLGDSNNEEVLVPMREHNGEWLMR